MNRRIFPVALFLAGVSLSAPPRTRPQSPPAHDATVAFMPDKGKFRILQQGTEAGTETFELYPSGSGWIARGETTLRASGSGDTRATGQLRLTADGAPTHYDWTSQASKKASGTVEFAGGVAKTSAKVEGGKAPISQDFNFNSPRVAVLDNNLYDQYAILARLFDWNAKGTQTFPVIIPQDSTPGTIDVQYVGPQSAGNTSLEVLRARTADLQIDLFFDAKHHLMRLEVPSAQVVILRQ